MDLCRFGKLRQVTTDAPDGANAEARDEAVRMRSAAVVVPTQPSGLQATRLFTDLSLVVAKIV